MFAREICNWLKLDYWVVFQTTRKCFVWNFAIAVYCRCYCEPGTHNSIAIHQDPIDRFDMRPYLFWFVLIQLDSWVSCVRKTVIHIGKKSVLRRIEYAYFVISSKYIVNANLHANSNACKICTIHMYVHIYIYMTTLVSGVEFDFYTNIQISLQCFLIESIQDYMWMTTLVLIPLKDFDLKDMIH